MQETQFPPFRMHKEEHDKVLAGMFVQIERWKQGHDVAGLRDWLDGAVGDWFVNHVDTMDFITAGFIAMKQKAG